MAVSTKVGLLASSERIRQRIRTDAERLLTEKASQAKKYAMNLAAESLHNDRPPKRRNLSKTGSGHHYINSFVVHTSINNRNRVRVELTNTSPVAVIIEKGSKPHVIAAGDKILRMPTPFGEKPVGRQQGSFATVGPPWAYAFWVNHPGTRGFQILGRTAKAVRSGQIARGTGIPSG